MKVALIIVSFHLFLVNAFGQSWAPLKVSWHCQFRGKELVLHDSIYPLNEGNKIVFSTLKFYVSNLQLLKNNKVVYTEPNSYHLIDCAVQTSQQIFLGLNQNLAFDAIRFHLGIDSITHSSGAMGGDLDPVNGMYWTWQSGYIHSKLEGFFLYGESSKRDFEFHLGGYQEPFNTLQTVTLHGANNEVNIGLSIDEFFAPLEVMNQKNIMSPSTDAVNLSKQLSNCFSIK